MSESAYIKLAERLDMNIRGVPKKDGEFSSAFMEYLEIFCDLVASAVPRDGEALRRTEAVFEAYLKTLVDHDPGVKIWKVLFGTRGGVERSMDMHFGR